MSLRPCFCAVLIAACHAGGDDDEAPTSVPGPLGLELPLDGHGPELLDIDAAVDLVRARYGNSALTRGVLLGRDAGLEVPLLPD